MNASIFRPAPFTLWLLLIGCWALVSTVHAEEEGAQEKRIQYIDMQPSFVMNFGGVKTKLRYLKADLSLRVDSKEAGAAVERHMPGLRNEIILLLSKQPDEVMFDNLKREALRLEALEALKAYMQEETGDPMIGDLLFTSFVVQR